MITTPRSKSTKQECSPLFQGTLLFFALILASLFLRILYMGSNDLIVEEAYYWNYSQHLDFGYLDHPPMVALLIKLFTSIFGTNEFAVRLPALIGWIFTAFFSFKLTNTIHRGAGLYAVVLLSILPFFFLHSFIMTPDQPMILCWAAVLYYLYQALILNKPHAWYIAGIWIGLGMLAKYTILLLAPVTLLYVCIQPKARSWLTRKEPYLAALISLIIFSPVIYWNATHEWASFIFQSSRRLHQSFHFSLHHLIGLLIFFVTPLGLIESWPLFKKSDTELSLETQRFLQIFTAVPLIIFGIFSLYHAIKFNWIGPGLLALIPWIAIRIQQSADKSSYKNIWFVSGAGLLFSYTVVMCTIIVNAPTIMSQKIFGKFIAWDALIQEFNTVAQQVEAYTYTTPIFAPLDRYNIASELSFYQTKLLTQKRISEIYPVIGRHIFGSKSLMYQYWTHETYHPKQTYILISNNITSFKKPGLRSRILHESPINKIWSHSQGRMTPTQPYYYQVVQLKKPNIFLTLFPGVHTVSG